MSDPENACPLAGPILEEIDRVEALEASEPPAFVGRERFGPSSTTSTLLDAVRYDVMAGRSGVSDQ